MKKVNQYLEDRIEVLMTIISIYKKCDSNLVDVYKWIQLFVSRYNDNIANNNDLGKVGKYYSKLT